MTSSKKLTVATNVKEPVLWSWCAEDLVEAMLRHIVEKYVPLAKSYISGFIENIVQIMWA